MRDIRPAPITGLFGTNSSGKSSCYYVPDGSTLLLEQPEIHLHPAVQSALADVMIDVVRHRNVQIIVESRSEHSLRREVLSTLVDGGFIERSLLMGRLPSLGRFLQFAMDDNFACRDFGDQIAAVEFAPALLGGLGKLERHGWRRLAYAATLGATGPVAHRRKRRLDGVRRPQAAPMLRGRS